MTGYADDDPPSRSLERIADNTPTLRDQFAMAAFPVVAAMISAGAAGHVSLTTVDRRATLDEPLIANMVFAIADACMAAREAK